MVTYDENLLQAEQDKIEKVYIRQRCCVSTS